MPNLTEATGEDRVKEGWELARDMEARWVQVGYSPLTMKPVFAWLHNRDIHSLTAPQS